MGKVKEYFYWEEDDEPGICPQCDGSGEGQHDGTRCTKCNGGGLVLQLPDEADRADHAWETRHEFEH